MVWVIQVLGIVNLTSLKFLGGISYELYLVHGIFIYLSKNYYSYGGTLIIVCYNTIHSNGIHAKSKRIEVY